MPAFEVDDATALLRRYEPVLRLTRGELFHPSSVEGYLARASLLSGSGGSARVLAGPATLTPAALAALCTEHRGEALSLRYVRQPMDRGEHRRWRRSAAPQPSGRASGAAAVGLLARVVPALMRLSLHLRGKVPGGWTAAAHVQTRSTDDADACHYYGHVLRDGGYVVLQYWFFYPMNDWRSSFRGVNDHEADWEQVSVVLTEEASALTPAWVLFASHDETGADLRRRWDDPDLGFVGDHPVVYVGAGSHSAACLPGDYLVTVAPELPAWLDRLRRRIARVLPWWDPTAAGIGLPFIDLRRGDGVSVGPGQDRGWHRHVIDDDTGWVRDYRGLWGLDTGDPWGGERAPAGPRYERSGAVRRSWAEPLAWADLDGEPVSRRDADARWQARRGQLVASLSGVRAELETVRDELRSATVADRVAGRSAQRPSPPRAALQDRVTGLRARQAQLAAELDAHDQVRDASPPVPHPHDHLRHRALPLHRDTGARARAMLVWASASSTMLFAALGLLLVFGQAGLLVPAAAIVMGVAVVEATLRGHLVGFVVNVALAAVIAVAAWAIVRLLLDNLRLGVGVLLLLAAAYMAGQTVSDAVLHRRPGRRD
ncbi:hypothetical protein ACI79C_21900 [Geodermatophilus sp. SYSU D00697]